MIAPPLRLLPSLRQARDADLDVAERCPTVCDVPVPSMYRATRASLAMASINSRRSDFHIGISILSVV